MEKAVLYLREQAVLANQAMLSAERNGDGFSVELYHAKMNAYVDAVRVVLHGDKDQEQANTWHKEYDTVQRMTGGYTL